MADNSSTQQSSGIFLSMLAVLFIGLKLTGYIDWSWWWVLAPLWAPLAVAMAFVAVASLIIALAEMWDARSGR